MAQVILQADTAANLPIQTIDVQRGRISNEIRLELPIVGLSYVRISGGFKRGANSRQAVVDFDKIELFKDGKRIWQNNWLFSLVRAVNPDLFTGGKESAAWLETTYLSDTLRVGRGNKGSCFLLERDLLPSPIGSSEPGTLCSRLPFLVKHYLIQALLNKV